ncbi:MAG TPA: hypothetical protein VH879_00730 [Gemmatimonadales bacterium]|jgi:predicted flap endonuclease-1-like 5' DNA nuclease
MLTLALKIAYLVLASMVGLLAGWLVKGLRGRGAQAEERSKQERLNALERDLAASQARERSLASAARAAEEVGTRQVRLLERDMATHAAQLASLHEENARLAESRIDMEERLAQAQQELTVRDRDLKVLRSRLNELEQGAGSAASPRGREVNNLVDRLSRELEEIRRTLAQREESLRTEESNRRLLQARLSELEPLAGEVHELEQRLGAAEREKDGARLRLETEVDQLHASLSEFQPIQHERDELLRTLQIMEEECRRHSARLAELEGLPAGAPRNIRSPKGRQPARPAGSPRRRRESGSVRDDLKLIHGIGPVLERALHGLGITRFRQIARWSDRDLERIARKLDDSPERIRRDRWMDGARREHIRKYGKDPLTGEAVAARP